MTFKRPFQHKVPSSLELVEKSDKAALPRSFFNPTHALLRRRSSTQFAQNNADTSTQSELYPHHEHKYIIWTSRRHRKSHPHPRNKTYNGTAGPSQSWIQTIWRMREIQYWNISWWIAIWFTIGSLVWCANGFIVLLPFFYPTLISEKVVSDAGGWTAWVGATIFFFASWPPIWEAWNKDDIINFNRSFHESAYPEASKIQYKQLAESENLTSSNPKQEKLAVSSHAVNSQQSDVSHENRLINQRDDIMNFHPSEKKWIWFTTSIVYWHDIGFLAAFVQGWAATIFWISGFTALPSILNSLDIGVEDGVFWTPQVVGGSGFIISAFLGLLEAQPRWYIPAFNIVPWVLSLFNFIGGIGFTLSGAFGYGGQSVHWLAYQSSLATFWGSWAFLIASVLQWWETVNYN